MTTTLKPGRAASHSSQFLQMFSRKARLVFAMAALMAGARAAQAQGFVANATMSSVNDGGGVFTYTIQLNNQPSSLNTIDVLWFGWVPGQFYLPSVPNTIVSPTGWS